MLIFQSLTIILSILSPTSNYNPPHLRDPCSAPKRESETPLSITWNTVPREWPCLTQKPFFPVRWRYMLMVIVWNWVRSPTARPRLLKLHTCPCMGYLKKLWSSAWLTEMSRKAALVFTGGQKSRTRVEVDLYLRRCFRITMNFTWCTTARAKERTKWSGKT